MVRHQMKWGQWVKLSDRASLRRMYMYGLILVQARSTGRSRGRMHLSMSYRHACCLFSLTYTQDLELL
jgi:hypothetical protein